MMHSYIQILSLARAGNPVRAWERFGELGLAAATSDIKALTLKGRLLKDLGDRATGDQRDRFYREASQAYLAANNLKTDTYPLINAATLALLARDPVQSGDLARQVLDLIEFDPEEGETPYWREATRAEALLLLGQAEEAESALASGIAKLPRAWEDHAATIGQFERIIAAQGGDMAWLEPYRPACSVHFSGLIGLDPDDPTLVRDIDQLTSELAPGFAFGALAAGADIMIAEAMLRVGASLHVTLPFERDRFREVSVEPFGSRWGARYDALLERAEIVEELWQVDDDAEKGLASLIEASNLVSMGHCLKRAEVLRSSARALAVAASTEPLRSHLDQWDKAGFPSHRIQTKRVNNGPRRANAQTEPMAPVAILAVRGATLSGLSLDGLQRLSTDEVHQYSGPIVSCLAAMRTIRKSSPEARAAMIVIPIGTRAEQDGASALSLQLVQGAGPGEFFADERTAMVAKVLEPANRVEEMGELGSTQGPLTIFAISLG